jgi:hypothetical protein
MDKRVELLHFAYRRVDPSIPILRKNPRYLNVNFLDTGPLRGGIKDEVHECGRRCIDHACCGIAKPLGGPLRRLLVIWDVLFQSPSDTVKGLFLCLPSPFALLFLLVLLLLLPPGHFLSDKPHNNPQIPIQYPLKQELHNSIDWPDIQPAREKSKRHKPGRIAAHGVAKGDVVNQGLTKDNPA